MSKSIPSIHKYMTVTPHTVGREQTLAIAEKLMSQYGIRHLPVLEGGKLIGIITDRDINFLKSFKDFDATQTRLSDVAIENVFSVTPEAKLDEVCDVMAEKKYGCALVQDNQKLVGIFTWVDALRAMSELLTTRLSK